MSADNRKQFHDQIKQVFVPVLKSDGFLGSGNTYRRVIGDVIHVVALQGSVSGGKCCVCLGIHLSFLPGFGTASDPKRIAEVDCQFRTRLKPAGHSDAWWPYGTTEREARASAESICDLYLQIGAPYFGRFSSFPDDFTRVTPAMLMSQDELPFPGGCTFGRLALALALIAQRVGRNEDARSFAEAGLSKAGDAVLLKTSFKQIIAAVP